MFNRQAHPGWMAVTLRPQRVDVAHVVRAAAGRPRLALLRSHERTGTEIQDLARLRRSLDLGRYRCTTLMDPGAYQILQVEAPAVADSELKAALRWSIREALDFPVEDALVDALRVPADGAPPGRPPLAFAVAAPRARVAERIRAFQRSGIDLRVVEVLETAQRNVAALFEQPGRGLAMLSFHDSGALLTFTCDRELYALRHIDVPAATVTDGADATRRQQAFERVGLELQRSLDNFDHQFSQITVQRVVVTAHGGRAALLDYLRANLYMPVEAADLASVVDLADDIRLDSLEAEARWLQPIALALRDE